MNRRGVGEINPEVVWACFSCAGSIKPQVPALVEVRPPGYGERH